MLEANLYNNKRRLLGSVFGEIQLQAGVSEIKINGERGEKPGFQPVLNILRRSEAALLQRVSIDGIEKVSPDYLAFLVWIASNTHTLAITNCTLGDCGFACLMSGILLPNGLTKLNLDLDHYDDVQVITRHQWKLLFEAVASSSSLETLWINADFEDIDDMGLLLVHTLRRNRSMTDFSLNTQTFYGASTTIPDLLTAAVLQTKVKALKLGQSRTRTLSRNILADVVCRHDCALRTLSLEYILPDLEENIGGAISESNSSVEVLEIRSAGFHCDEAMETIRLFDSLKQLDLTDNSISDLAPLDYLLLRGTESTLEDENLINEENFKIFLQKLPRMNSLKTLEVGLTLFSVSISCLIAFKDAVWLNTSLENVLWNVSNPVLLKQLDSMIRLATSLNRGANRKLLDHYPLPLPQNLWAKILKRAMTINYYGLTDNFNAPTSTSPRFDVVFWLLRNKMHF